MRAYNSEVTKYVLFLLSLQSLSAATMMPLNLFPEEKIRHQWDKGCEDWSFNFLQENGPKRNPDINVVKKEKALRIFTEAEFVKEKGEKSQDVMNSVVEMLQDGFHIKDWLLPGINENPSGEKYFVSIDGLETQELKAKESYVFTGPFSFNLLFVNVKGRSSLIEKLDKVPSPSCPLFAGHKDLWKMTIRVLPRKGLLDLMFGEAYFIPSEQGASLKARIVVKPDPLVYEIMPESIVKNELHARGRRMFENFIDYRRQKAVEKLKSREIARTAK